MPERRILVADSDVKVADEFRSALGTAWVVVGSTSGPAALAVIQSEPCDVIVVDIDVPGLSGVEVLDLVRIAHPRTIRFLAATENHKERAMDHVAGGDQFLAKPYDTATLKATVERYLAADNGIISNSMRELIGRIRAFPTIPSLYLEVVAALNNPDATTAEVGAIVAKDMAMTTQLLQMLNSAYFSFPRTITDPSEAVGLLGFETVKSLVMSVKLRSQYDKIKPVYFSIDSVWRHSTNVARTAKDIAMLETGDNALAAASFTAGLLHDLGKVILAANFDGQYSGAHAIARKNQLPLCDVESDIFGANHGQIASYLFGLWGMPAPVMEAAAQHHHPQRAGNKGFTALTAVHVANALEYEGNPVVDDLPVSMIDMSYLAELGLADRLPDWRNALDRIAPDHSGNTSIITKSTASSANNTQFISKNNTAFISKSANTAFISKPGAKPAVAAQTAQSTGSSNQWDLRRWLLVGLAGAAAVSFLCWLEVTRLQHEFDKSLQEPVAEATAPAVVPAAVKIAPSNAVPTPAIVAAAVVPPPAVTPKPVATPQLVAKTPTPVSTPKPVASTQPAGPATPKSEQLAKIDASTQPPQISAEDSAFKGLRLQGIFYSADHPSAIINGEMARVNQQVAMFHVLEINRDSVTLEYQNQRKVLYLR
jgi:HD-like signal output (HDOD) protein/CheY-like chemotaxis protein